ncbi:hypothetical protein N7494_005202 [Penicillium frequentans]|uniref:Uncharacterized protein n=1 Tax=Penicillium frequentans TaxID=3151616 RepID=A0AAD6CXQ2_9EURO|nr:hypothetical protein N7494_005202 [Penicillium glabrum]
MVSERGHRTTEASAIHCSPASRPSANSPETWFTLTHETFLRGESFDDDGVDHSARTARRLTRRSTANLLLGEPKKETRKNREESRVLKLSVPSIRSRLETASSNALTGIIRQSARMNTVASSSNNAFDAEPYEGQSRVFEQPYIGITSYPIKPGALKDPLNKSHTYKKMEGVHPSYAQGNTEERPTIKHLLHAVDLVPPLPKRKSTELNNETREINSSTVVEFQKISKRQKDAEFSCGTTYQDREPEDRGRDGWRRRFQGQYMDGRGCLRHDRSTQCAVDLEYDLKGDLATHDRDFEIWEHFVEKVRLWKKCGE